MWLASRGVGLISVLGVGSVFIRWPARQIANSYLVRVLLPDDCPAVVVGWLLWVCGLLSQ